MNRAALLKCGLIPRRHAIGESMMLGKTILTACLSVLVLVSSEVSAKSGLADLVNPLIGSQSTPQFSHGNTYPAVARPNGMTFWTPRTGDTTGWIYQYSADRVKGFQATHQPSPWMGDYGQFGVAPFSGEAPSEGWDFEHANESAKPYLYSVNLPEAGVATAVSATTRCSIWRLQYSTMDDCRIAFDVYDDGEAKYDDDKQEVVGTARGNQGGVAGDFGCRFVASFDCPAQVIDSTPKRVVMKLSPGPERVVVVRVGTSFIDHDQARTNLKAEIGDKGFDAVVEESKAVWEKRLSVIQIEGATPEQLVTFYSSLYRLFLFPRLLHEETSDGELVHYSPYSGKVELGEMYADNGFWDTFRAVYPFLSIVDPDLEASMIRGWINAYREGGWFPTWASPGYRECMIGTHIDAIVADALAKGIEDFDVNAAFRGCLNNATVVPNLRCYGRRGLAAYMEIGYVPCDEFTEATSRTLEYAYDDWCVAQIAKRLGMDQAAASLLRRSKNYRNVYDQGLGFMRGRRRDGAWLAPFEEDSWGGPFTEGSAWHYSWSVMHDVPGLIDLMGGEEAFIQKLDKMLETPPTFGVGHYGREIHEMTEMVACGMGQYAHGNQPVHHVLYLYSFAGAPWKTAQSVRRVVDSLYGPGPDGYCGDEDNGQMSAWYLFSTLGFYPVCPGEPAYVIGSPRFGRAILNLPNGKQFVIQADHSDDQNVFVAGLKLNGAELLRTWITHEEIANGGVLDATMSNNPDKTYGKPLTSRPFNRSIESEPSREPLSAIPPR